MGGEGAGGGGKGGRPCRSGRAGAGAGAGEWIGSGMGGGRASRAAIPTDGAAVAGRRSRRSDRLRGPAAVRRRWLRHWRAPHLRRRDSGNRPATGTARGTGGRGNGAARPAHVTRGDGPCRLAAGAEPSAASVKPPPSRGGLFGAWLAAAGRHALATPLGCVRDCTAAAATLASTPTWTVRQDTLRKSRLQQSMLMTRMGITPKAKASAPAPLPSALPRGPGAPTHAAYGDGVHLSPPPRYAPHLSSMQGPLP